MNLFLAFLAVLGGATLSVQAGINAQLQSHWAQSSVLAALVSFGVGTLALASYVLIARIPIPPLAGKTALWHWTGGFLGAYLVTTMAYLAPRFGAATLVALILAGQLGGSILVDHFGLVGYAKKSISLTRVLGIALVGAGVWLIKR